jgi:transglycosylase-like protein with SLT domain
MDLLTALLACNLYTADESLVRAIAQSNSHSNPYYVSDPAIEYTEVDVPPESKTLDEAVTRAKEILSKGGQPVLGLMQIPPSWTAFFGRELADAFDPCTSVAIGSAMLSAFDEECARERPSHPDLPAPRRRRRLPPAALVPSRRACVIRKYGEAIRMADFEMVTNLELGFQRPVIRGSVSVDAPVFPPDNARAWGPDCILVPWEGISGLAPRGLEDHKR